MTAPPDQRKFGRHGLERSFMIMLFIPRSLHQSLSEIDSWVEQLAPRRVEWAGLAIGREVD